MQFRDVLGHAQVKARLIKSAREARISHAQLFFGPPGTGKLPLAIAYARYICCTDPAEDDACGVCPSCAKIAKLVHPDLHFVFPVVNPKQGSVKAVSDHYIEKWREAVVANPYLSENQWYDAIGAENKQGFISRQESNEVMRKLSMKSYESEYKVLIIWLAEKMNAPAANSLLKLIEEPPQKTVFLLISEHTDHILPTILSRTQMIRIPPLEAESIRAGLSERFPGKETIAADVIRRSNGNFSTAVELMESGEQEQENFDEFVFLMRKCYGREIVDIHRWADKMARLGRERLKLFLTYCLRMIRENFILNLRQSEISFLSGQEDEFSKRFARFIHEGNVFAMAEEFEKAIDHIEANGQPRIILLDLAIKNIFLLKQKSPAD